MAPELIRKPGGGRRDKTRPHPAERAHGEMGDRQQDGADQMDEAPRKAWGGKAGPRNRRV